MLLFVPLLFVGILIIGIAILLRKLGKSESAEVAAAPEESKQEEITLQELQRAERKKKKEEERDERERMYKQKEAKQALKEEKYQAKLRQREEERAKVLEEEQKEKEKKQKEEEDIYQQWKSNFTVEEVKEELEDPNKLQSFIDYITKAKYVDLQRLCNEFNLLTSEAVDRIKNLEAGGRLQGIFDSRGVYIYFTENELIQIKEYIMKVGCISKRALIDFCGKLLPQQYK
jgi:hypothetical protein